MNQGIWKYADRLGKVPPEDCCITLGEGATPLVRSRHIGPALGLSNLYFKLESCNPSGSYKDRFATAAVSHLLARGVRQVIATSSGNAGAALAAACAVARLPLTLAIVETAPDDKLRQMLAYGARLARIRGFGIIPETSAATFSLLRQIASRPSSALEVSAYSVSPDGMRGVETISLELAEAMGDSLDHVFIPSGGGGLCLAVARGFSTISPTPAIHCVQPEGNATIAGPLREGRDHGRIADPCTTTISGLQVPSLLDANATIAACRASGGNGHLVTDEHIYQLQSRLAREEGIFCEPAGAVALAGALQAVETGEVSAASTIICLVTGSGFKDSKSLAVMADASQVPLIESEEFEKLVS